MATIVEKGIEWIFKSQLKSMVGDKKKLIEFTNSKQDPWPPRTVLNGLTMKIMIINGFKCFVLKNKKGPITNHHLIYIHGGAYIAEITHFHWMHIKSLIKETNAIVYVPIYPLTNNKYSSQLDAIKFLLDLYKEITTEEPQCIYTIMGDSAGGNFALILAQQIKINNYLKPKNIILLSPVISMENTPEANKISHSDPVLPYNLLINCMNWQLKGQSPKNPLFSPIYGDSKDIGNIYIFIGEREILLHYINQWVGILDKQGVKYKLDVKKEMFHDYPLFIFDKNAKETNKKISIILTKQLQSV